MYVNDLGSFQKPNVAPLIVLMKAINAQSDYHFIWLLKLKRYIRIIYISCNWVCGTYYNKRDPLKVVTHLACCHTILYNAGSSHWSNTPSRRFRWPHTRQLSFLSVFYGDKKKIPKVFNQKLASAKYNVYIHLWIHRWCCCCWVCVCLFVCVCVGANPTSLCAE